MVDGAASWMILQLNRLYQLYRMPAGPDERRFRRPNRHGTKYDGRSYIETNHL